MSQIDTEVRGEAGLVRAAATWIRSFGEKLGHATDDAVDARRRSYDCWEGHSGDGYRARETQTIQKGEDLHRPVGRAAQAVDAYAVELGRLKQAMARIRGRASAGHLIVNGFIINEPVIGASDMLPGFEYHGDDPDEKTRLAGEYAAQLRRLFGELQDDVKENRDKFDDWIETNLRPMVEFLDGEDLLGLKGAFGPLGALGIDLTKNVALEAAQATGRLPRLGKDLLRVGEAGYELGNGAVESIRKGDPTPLTQAATSQAVNEGIDGLVNVGEKNPLSVLAVGTVKTGAEEMSDAAVDGAIGREPELPPPPGKGEDYE